MLEEELLDINMRIRQIEGQIARRREKVAQAHNHYANALKVSCELMKEKEDKRFYLERSNYQKIDYRSLSPQEYQKVKEDLKRKSTQSRLKVKNFHNDLKDLDELQKLKSKLWILCLQKKREKERSSPKKDYSSTILKQKQKNVKNDNSSLEFCRTVKQRSNPFAHVRGEKFIQISQEAKKNDENVGSKIMRHFGVGLETTPLGVSLKKQQKKEEMFAKTDKKKYRQNCMSVTCFGKKFSQAFDKNSKILGLTYSPRNLFEDRVRKIFKYHGQFWENQMQFD